jgi:N-acetylneuraminic acid mutarotase
LVVGGFLLGVDFTPDARTLVYDAASDEWADAAPMPEGTQRGAAGAVAHQGWLYVVGGIQVASQTAVSRYSPEEDRWEELSRLPVALDHLSAHDVEGRLLVVGGRTDGIGRHTATVLELEDASGEFLEKSAMPTSRVVGGEGNAAEPSGVFDQVEAYAPSTDQWRALLPMRTPRHGMGAAVVDGALYVPGGADRQGFAAVATHERLVPVAAPP